MTLTPIEIRDLQGDAERAPEGGGVLARVAESYEQLWADREGLRRRVAELEAQFDRQSSRPGPRQRSKGVRLVSHFAFTMLALVVAAAAAATVAILGGLWRLEPASQRGAEGTPGRLSANAPAESPASVPTSPSLTTPSAAEREEPVSAGSRAPDVRASPDTRSAAASSPTSLSPTLGPPSSYPASGAVTLDLTAARGDSWLQVRAGSQSGKVLFEGVLPQGESMTFAEDRLWIRFGVPAYLDAVLNGEPVEDLPDGTADALVTTRGVELLGEG